MLKVQSHGEMNLLDCLRSSGILLESPCNGKGICGKCKVKILSGAVSALTEQEKRYLTREEIAGGIRLACLTIPQGEVELNEQGLLQEKPNNVLGGEAVHVELNPLLTVEQVDVTKPTLENGYSLSRAMGDTLLREAAPPLSLLEKLPGLAQEKHLWKVSYAGKNIDLVKQPERYGLAVDIGTTTVAVSLIDLATGDVRAEEGFVNPQKAFGLDVLSRIHYDMEHTNGVLELRRVIVERLQKAAEEMVKRANVALDAIYEVVVGANATMLHALLGIPLKSLGTAPYSSVFTQPVTVLAKELGFALHDQTRLYCIPSVSTFIGGDIVSGVLASQLDRAEDTVLLVDIGTNGEIVLSQKGRMYSCSCAAGPALEGMNISCGMRAEPGAVEHVTLGDEGVQLKTISNLPPVGLCGSGLLEAISQVVEKGIVGKTGRIVAESAFVDTDEDGKRRVVLDRERSIYLTQSDIRQVQFCKGAILSGILTLMQRLGLEEREIDRVIVAGQFGKHLNPESLTGAGLIPASLKERISYIGNSSMMGAHLCLLNQNERRRAEEVAKNIEYIELSVSPGYEKLFTKCLQFECP